MKGSVIKNEKKFLIILLTLIIILPIFTVSASAANYSMTTGYAVTSAALTYFKNCLGNTDPWKDYIIFQNTQYVTACFIGEFTVSGNVITCRSGQLITYDSSVGTNDRRYISNSTGTGHTVTVTSGVIYYTSLKGISSNPIPASVMEFKDRNLIDLTQKLLEVLIIIIFVYIIFSFVKKRWLSVL